MKHIALVFILGMIFSACSYLPEEAAFDSHLKVDRGDYAIYYSGLSAPSNAFMMIPGGLVDPHAYECWIDRLVAEDPSVAVVLMKYSSNLAITNIKKALKVANELTGFSNWAIGGHSLGGVVATTLVHEHMDYFDGLVLLASWSRTSTDLSGWGKPVLSMYATEDQVATAQEVLDNSRYLPQGIAVSTPEDLAGLSNRTAYFEIVGGNHSGFGCYGLQKGDGEGLITPSTQQEQMVAMIHSYLDLLW